MVATIYRKELRDTLRDRRTLFMMIGLPILLYPILFMALGSALESSMARIASGSTRVAVWVGPLEGLRAALEEGGEEPLELLALPPPGEELRAEATRLLQAEEVDVVVVAGEGESVLAGLPGALQVLYDTTVPRSVAGAGRVEGRLEAFRDRLAREALEGRGVDGRLLRPFDVQRENTASQERMGGFVAGRMLPFFMVLMVIMGAFYPALDLTAGEKERGTLQTLLCAPVHPQEIVGGKFLTAASVAMVAALANLVSMGLAVNRMSLAIPEGTTRFQLDLGTVLLTAALLVPTALFVSAAMMAVAILARDFKEGQNYLTPAMVVGIVPCIFAVIPDMELDPLTAFAPILNVTLFLREALAGAVDVELTFLVLLSSSAYALMALMAASRLFSQEHVLFGTGRPWTGLRAAVALSGAGARPTPSGALLLFALGLVLLFYAGSLLQQRAGLGGFVASEWCLVLLPAVLLAFAGRHDLREVFSLRLPGPGALAGAMLLGCSAWVPASAWMELQERLVPMPPAYLEAMREFFYGPPARDLGAAAFLFVFALTPAVCEEGFFRGYILSGVAGALGRLPSVLLVGLLFGAYHMSVYRIVPAAIIGVIIGFAVWQSRSIVVAVLIHGLNNALLLWAGRDAGLGNVLGLDAEGVVDWSRASIFAIPLGIGLWLLHRERPAGTWDDAALNAPVPSAPGAR